MCETLLREKERERERENARMLVQGLSAGVNCNNNIILNNNI